MRLASRKSVFLICLLAIVFSTFAALLLEQNRADATTVKPATSSRVQSLVGTQYSVNSNLFISLSRPVVLSQDYQAALENRISGFGCSTLGFAPLQAGCRKVIDTVDSAVDSAVEFAKDPVNAIMNAVTEFGYRTIGGLVGWAGNGVISLVAGQREECMTGADGGTFDEAGQAAQCEARIALDYFPQGSELAQQSAAALKTSNDAQIKQYEGLISTTLSAEDRATYQKALDNLNAANAVTGEAGADKSTPNDVFYVPKSPIATATFDREYNKYVLIAIMLMVPMLIAAALQSVISAKPFLLFKSVVIMIPVTFLSIAIAPRVTRQLMAIVDGFCAIVLRDTRADMQGFFGSSAVTIGGAALSVPLLIPFLLVGLVFAFAAILVWFVLSMREASVALIAVFLPIAFAASIWPALSKWALRAIKLLIAAIISKVFIVGAISLGIGVFSGSSAGGQLSFSHLIYGSTIFFIAAFSPHLVMKFFDEIGDAINAAGGTGALSRGLSVGGNANGIRSLVGANGVAGMLAGRSGGGGGIGGGEGGGGSAASIGGVLGSTMASNAPGATPTSVGAGGSRGAIAGGGGGSEAASAGAAGARSVGGDGGEVAGAAYAGAGMGAAPGETFGSMSDQGARATGLAVGQAAAREGASPQQAAALAADATTQAQGGAPGTTSALGAQVGAQAATSTAADRSNPGAGRLGRVGGALIGGPLGYAAVRGIGNARRRNQTAELEGRWR